MGFGDSQPKGVTAGLKLLIVGFSALLLVAVVIWIYRLASEAAAENKVQADLAAIPVEKPTSAMSHDFGFVEPDSLHAVAFTLTNPSDEPVAITNVQREGSECAVPNPPKEVPARGAAQVKVTFVAPKDKTDYSGQITLHTSDAKNPAIVLRIAAKVAQPLQVRPALLEVGKISFKQDRHAEIAVINGGKSPVRLLYSTSTNPGIVAMIPAGATVPPLGKLNIPVMIHAAELRNSSLKAVISIGTNCPAQSKIEVAVACQKEG